MIYIFTSVLFFLLSLKYIFFWVAIWQKSGYRVSYFKSSLKAYIKKSSVLWFVLMVILILLYGLVIFNDGFTMWFHIAAIMFYIITAGIFIKDIMQNIFVKPILSFRALSIILVSLFFVAFFYSIPLLDRYLWLIVMTIFIPFICVFLITLSGFPSEIYEDYTMQKIKRLLKKNKNLQIIAVIQMRKENNVQVDEFVSTLTDLRNALENEKAMFLFSVNYFFDDTKKLLQLTKPGVVILNKQIIIEEKQYYKKVFMLFPKKTDFLLSPKEVETQKIKVSTIISFRKKYKVPRSRLKKLLYS